jgi:hypothetical protein
MPVRWIRLMSVLVLLLLARGALAELRVFELQHTTPESLLPVIEPLLGPYESVSAHRNSLVVNAGEGALTRIEGLLAELDRPQRNLLISVRRRGSAQALHSGTAVSGTLQQGDVSISTGSGREDSGVELRTVRRSSTHDSEGEQRIRALEGSTVLISDGQLVALATGSVFGPGIGYEALERGFGVRARVSGAQVMLDIETRDERLEGGQIHAGSIVTSVRGALGEWVALGGSQSSSAASGAAIGSGYSTHSAHEQQYEVRVELAP